MTHTRRTIAAFDHQFGAACGSYTHHIPAGTLCDWHAENGCYYVRPSEIKNGVVRHDAEYYGIRVETDNLEA